MNSGITDYGRGNSLRPACRNSLGFDSDVFGIRPALRSGGDRHTFRFAARDEGYLLRRHFAQTDTRR
ncbi:hypothetical protein [Streptomyces sp. NPDC101393]|uniref:hypothetical protein n=1 Tax=Streptomyces sp. NPDC101393 TaxID=3366141 RepID=UPI00382806EE